MPPGYWETPNDWRRRNIWVNEGQTHTQTEMNQLNLQSFSVLIWNQFLRGETTSKTFDITTSVEVNPGPICNLYKWVSLLISEERPISSAYRVTLKILRSRTQRNTEIPSGDMTASSTRMVSTMPPHTTKQSKRLNRDTKYACRPKLYIFTSISNVNIARRTLLATSKEKGIQLSDIL